MISKTESRSTEFFQTGRITWVLLLVLGFSSRFAFIAKSHIVFTSDEAYCLKYALHFGDSVWQSYLYPASRIFDGVRFWVSTMFFRCTNGWLQTGALVAIFFNLTGCVLWVYWVYRRLSPLAAFTTAVLLAIPPACLDYYATLLERRQVSVILGAIFALGYEKWFSNFWYSFLFGLLAGWGFWEDPFIIFFILGLILSKISEDGWKRILPLGTWGPIVLGVVLSGGYGAIREWQSPQFQPGYITHGLAGFSSILYRIRLLIQAFPQFWNDNMPTGYLQASQLGQNTDPMSHGTLSIFFSFWTVFLFGAALVGYAGLSRRWRRGKSFVVTALTPVIGLLLFFLLSDHVSDALCFRYFAYWPVAIAIGLGALVDSGWEKERKRTIVFVVLLVAIQGGILLHRIIEIPETHPLDKIIQVLDQIDLKSGWANYWVADGVNYLSGNQICLNEYNGDYNGHPVDRKAEWLAYHNPKIGVVAVDGLDRPQSIHELMMALVKIGYHPVAQWVFKEGWSVTEFQKLPER
jgi:hypothetical protein